MEGDKAEENADGQVYRRALREGRWLGIQKEVRQMVRHAEGGQADG